MSFGGAVGVAFCVGVGEGFVAEGDGVGVADGVCTGAVVVAGTLAGTGEATGPAVQPVRASTAASASALLRNVTAGRASGSRPSRGCAWSQQHRSASQSTSSAVARRCPWRPRTSCRRRPRRSSRHHGDDDAAADRWLSGLGVSLGSVAVAVGVGCGERLWWWPADGVLLAVGVGLGLVVGVVDGVGLLDEAVGELLGRGVRVARRSLALRRRSVCVGPVTDAACSLA